jgi:hypothetical protein
MGAWKGGSSGATGYPPQQEEMAAFCLWEGRGGIQGRCGMRYGPSGDCALAPAISNMERSFGWERARKGS